jgi:hypothetical protein
MRFVESFQVKCDSPECLNKIKLTIKYFLYYRFYNDDKLITL